RLDGLVKEVEELEGNGDQGSGGLKNRQPWGCSYKEFLACNPKEYDEKGGAIVFTYWIEKIESVQDARYYSIILSKMPKVYGHLILSMFMLDYAYSICSVSDNGKGRGIDIIATYISWLIKLLGLWEMWHIGNEIDLVVVCAKLAIALVSFSKPLFLIDLLGGMELCKGLEMLFDYCDNVGGHCGYPGLYSGRNGLVVQEEVVMVCHENVVRIPLEGDEIRRVHGECTQRVVKTLMNTKTSKGRDAALAEMLRDLDQQIEKRADDGCTLWIKLYSRYEYEIRYHPVWSKGMILASQKGGDSRRECSHRKASWYNGMRLMHPRVLGTYRERIVVFYLGDMYCSHGVEKDIVTYVSNCLNMFRGESYEVKDFGLLKQPKILDVKMRDRITGILFKSLVIWAEIGRSSLIGPKLVQETTDKVVLVKERPNWQEIIQRAMFDLCVSVRVEVVRSCIVKGDALEAYRLRLPEELSSVHDTFHVSNLKKCLADANLHVPLNEIKIDKTLRFVEEPVEIMDRGIRSLKRSKISLVKVRWN
ncbi:hypothetical protein Tco_0584165, partial [Tanacetum coccineum]